MYVNLLQTIAGLRPAQKVIAVITVVDGEVRIEGNIPQSLIDVIEDQRKRVLGDRAFLHSLEREFSGSFIRAKFFKN